MRKFIKKQLLAWADREREKKSERRKRFEAEAEEARLFLIEVLLDGECVHARRKAGEPRMVYCDDCVIGNFHGDLSHGASLCLCGMSRHYSK